MRYTSILFMIVVAGLVVSCQHGGPSKPSTVAGEWRDKGETMIPCDLRCEYRVSPLGIDAEAPRLSWKLDAPSTAPRGLVQQFYQILAASALDVLAKDTGDLWDSERRESSQQNQIAYEGAPLRSGQQVWWKVRVWDNTGRVSAYSEPTSWEMGLLEDADWKSQWIQRKEAPVKDEQALFAEHPSPMFRRDFIIDKPIKRARVYVTGLGYYELRLNGEKVGDNELDPGWTSFDKRVFYSVFDVTNLIKVGSNAAGCMLGNGWYNPLPLHMWGKINPRENLCIGLPCFRLKLLLDFEDGTRGWVATNDQWRTASSPILKNNIYLGEVYDARLEQPGWDQPGFDDCTWEQAVEVSGPPGELQAQPIPPVRVTEIIRPVSVTEQTPGVFIFDLGKNIAGRVRLKCTGTAGTTVHLRYGELLNADGSLNPMTSVCGQIKNVPVPEGSQAPSTAWQADAYILHGGEDETYTPQFSWHGFRYVEVTGFPGQPTLDSIEGERMHTDVASVGRFACSNELFNRIQEITVDTLRGNLHSVQSDCPHRERFGYGGDLFADSEMGMYNFDMASLYSKIVRDFGDAVRPNGGFTETAPYVGIADAGFGEGSGPVDWGVAHPLLQWKLYQYYGERQLLEEQYEAGKKWFALLESRAVDNVLNFGLGDHETIAPKQIEISGTAVYFYNAELMARIARILNKPEEAAQYDKAAKTIRDTFNAKFLNAETGVYGTGTQANQAYALFMGLAPDSARAKVLDVLKRDILEQNKGHLSTGIFGTRFMLSALSEYGAPEVAYGMVNQKTFPGWGYMLEHGATTLWEHWEFSDNTFSHNHPMFGSVSEWFFAELGGIKPKPDACAFDQIEIKPCLTGDLTWAATYHDSVRGRIVSAWRIEKGVLYLDITIPPNTMAEIFVPIQPNGTVLESGKPASEQQGIATLGIENGYVRYKIGSGQYRFQTEWIL